MTLGNVTDLETTIVGAFRNEWAQVIKAATGPQSTIAVVVAGGATSYIGPVGMFVKFDKGDEVTVAGWSMPSNNGLKWVDYLSADFSTMMVQSDTGAVMANESAGPTVTLTAGIPGAQKLDGWAASTDATKPYCRETFAPNNNQSASLSGVSRPGGPSMTRMTGLYWLHIMYPINCGTNGISRLRGKLIAQIYPNRGILFNGQTIRILIASPKGNPVEGDDFVSGATVFGFQADAINP